MQTKLTIISLGLVGVLIGGAMLFSGDSGRSDRAVDLGSIGSAQQARAGEAVMEDGVQYIDITARGGYTPRTTTAQAGVPTVIRMKTENTYDCSLAVVVPDIGYRSFLPQSGVTEISVPVEKAQGTLRGMCSMAMYHFEVQFK